MSEKVFLHRFWEEYPDADAIPAFKALRNKRGDEASSRIMWYIRFLNDPLHEYVGSLPREDRDKLLIEYCQIKKADLNSPLFKAAVAWYVNEYMSETRKAFAALQEKIFQSEVAIRTGVIYSPDDIDTYNRAIKSLKELKREFDSSRHDLNEEKKESRAAKMFGQDQFVSPADEGTLF